MGSRTRIPVAALALAALLAAAAAADVHAAGTVINAEGDVDLIQVNLPIGRYIFALQLRDQAGHASAVLTVEFEVVDLRG